MLTVRDLLECLESLLVPPKKRKVLKGRDLLQRLESVLDSFLADLVLAFP